MMSLSTLKVGLVGGRGYVGRELVALLAGHPTLEVAWAISRSQAGMPLRELVPALQSDVCFESLSPKQAAEYSADAVVLALPNGESAPWVDALSQVSRPPVLVDLSTDHRWDPDWAYGLPELHRQRIARARRVANPGCYATGIQLALAPLRGIAMGSPVAFGVSGYSGAGTAPSPRNDCERLRHNLMAYGFEGHAHEREVNHHLPMPAPVRFLPHVAEFFRGIHLSLAIPLLEPASVEEVAGRFHAQYEVEPLVEVCADAPEVGQVRELPGVRIGGFALGTSGQHLALCVVLDNLLKGAATQAVQNLNLCFGLPELSGIVP